MMIELTKRVEQVCSLIAKGMSDKEIAKELNMAPMTVRLHGVKARQIFNAKNRTELALKYLEDRGILKNEKCS